MMNDILPASVRRWAYVVFAIVGVVFGAVQTAINTAGTETPVWLAVAFQVYLYVGGSFGLIAATNTTAMKSTNEVIEIETVDPTASYTYNVPVYDLNTSTETTAKHAKI